MPHIVLRCAMLCYIVPHYIMLGHGIVTFSHNLQLPDASDWMKSLADRKHMHQSDRKQYERNRTYNKCGITNNN